MEQLLLATIFYFECKIVRIREKYVCQLCLRFIITVPCQHHRLLVTTVLPVLPVLQYNDVYIMYNANQFSG